MECVQESMMRALGYDMEHDINEQVAFERAVCVTCEQYLGGEGCAMGCCRDYPAEVC